MTDEPIEDTPSIQPTDAGIRDLSTLLAAKRGVGQTVEYRFDFENWDGTEAHIDFTLKRPVFAQGFWFGYEESEASAAEATQKWRREGDRSGEPKGAYAHALYVAKELVVAPRVFRAEDGVMALPQVARIQLPRKLMTAVGLGPKFWMEMRGESAAGEALEALLRQPNSATTSAAPQSNSEPESDPEKSGPSSSLPEPIACESDATQS